MGRTNRRRDRWLKKVLEAIARPFFHRPRLALDAIRSHDPRRILIVRQHNQMGDMLCAVPAFRAIRETFPRAQTMLITAPVNNGVVEGNPYLDEILLFDKVTVRKSPRSVLEFWKQLRAFEADLAIVLNTVSFSGTSAWLAVLSGARFAIGGDSTPFGWSFSRWLYNLEMPSSPTVEGHAIDHGLEPLQAIGIHTDDRSTLIVPGPPAVREARDFLASIGSPPFVAVHPGAGKTENRWPPERFAKCIRYVMERGANVYVVEGPVDGPATRATLDAAGIELPVLRNVDLRTVAAALAETEIALVNDTGVMHVAGAVSTRTLALFGPTPAASWQPPSPRLDAIQSPTGHMDGISFEEVLEWLGANLPSAARAQD